MRLSNFYFAAKLHKEVAGSRPIHGGSIVATTAISIVLSRAMRLVIAQRDRAWMNLFFKYTGINMDRSPILVSTDEFVKYLENLNVRTSRGVIDVGKLELCSADFASLNPSIPHDDLISKINIMVNYIFSHKKNEFNQGN